jgi:hypothetical protein
VIGSNDWGRSRSTPKTDTRQPTLKVFENVDRISDYVLCCERCLSFDMMTWPTLLMSICLANPAAIIAPQPRLIFFRPDIISLASIGWHRRIYQCCWRRYLQNIIQNYPPHYMKVCGHVHPICLYIVPALGTASRPGLYAG